MFFPTSLLVIESITNVYGTRISTFLFCCFLSFLSLRQCTSEIWHHLNGFDKPLLSFCMNLIAKANRVDKKNIFCMMVCVFVTAQNTNSSYIISMTNGRIIIRRLTVKIFQILWVINDIYDYCLWIRYIALGYDTMRCDAMLATASLCSNRFYVLICVCRRVQQNPYFWSPNFERFRRENNDKSTFWLVLKKNSIELQKKPHVYRFKDISIVQCLWSWSLSKT